MKFLFFFRSIVEEVTIITNSRSKQSNFDSKQHIIHSLSLISSKVSPFTASIATFASLSRRDSSKIFDLLHHFFPAIVSRHPPEIKRSIFDFFPQLTSMTSPLAYVVGFISEYIYSLLATACFEANKISDDAICSALFRKIFIRTQVPTINTFSFRILELILRNYLPLITLLTRANFPCFMNLLGAYTQPMSLSSTCFVPLFRGLCGMEFPAEYNSDFITLLDHYVDLFSNFSPQPEIIDSFFDFLSKVACQLRRGLPKIINVFFTGKNRSLYEEPHYFANCCSAVWNSSLLRFSRYSF